MSAIFLDLPQTYSVVPGKRSPRFNRGCSSLKVDSLTCPTEVTAIQTGLFATKRNHRSQGLVIDLASLMRSPRFIAPVFTSKRRIMDGKWIYQIVEQKPQHQIYSPQKLKDDFPVGIFQ